MDGQLKGYLKHGFIGFVFDTNLCRNGDDNLIDALCFFTGLSYRHLVELYPLVASAKRRAAAGTRRNCRSCANMDDYERSDSACQLVGQLMGTVQFVESSMAFPHHIQLTTGRCCLLREQQFIWTLYISDAFATCSAATLLDLWHSSFTLLHGNLASLSSTVEHQSVFYRRLHCQLRPLLVLSLGSCLLTLSMSLTQLASTADLSRYTEQCDNRVRAMLSYMIQRYRGLFGCVFVNGKLLTATDTQCCLISTLSSLCFLDKEFFTVPVVVGEVSGGGGQLGEDSLLASVCVHQEVIAQLDRSALSPRVSHLDSDSLLDMSFTSIDSDAESLSSLPLSLSTTVTTATTTVGINNNSGKSSRELIGALAFRAISAQRRPANGVRGTAAPDPEHQADSESLRQLPHCRRRRRLRPASTGAAGSCGGAQTVLEPRLVPVGAAAGAGHAPLWLYLRRCVQNGPPLCVMLLMQPYAPSTRALASRVPLKSLERNAKSIIGLVSATVAQSDGCTERRSAGDMRSHQASRASTVTAPTH